MINKNNQKIKTSHLNRKAFVYVRQSTMKQVLKHTESRERQYATAAHAIGLGWRKDLVEVIDDDQGMTGADAKFRLGFQRLVTEVALGNVGIVMGLEVSRLARNNADFQQLLYICGMNDTLVYDSDAVYDLSVLNDRLILGLKGTMSEVELFTIKNRLQGGILSKASKCELNIKLPVGFVYTEAGRVVLDPDAQVQKTINLFFKSFDEIGSSIGVVRKFLENGFKFPTRPIKGPYKGELHWTELDASLALRILHNPRYAGAYAYGRTKLRKSPSGGASYSKRSRDDWHVLQKDVHDGYITWEQFEANEKRLQSNILRSNSGPIREGAALLQGIAYCGVCGRRLSVSYKKYADNVMHPVYVCDADYFSYGHKRCSYIPGRYVDQIISDTLLAKVTPIAVREAVAVQREVAKRMEDADKLLRKQVDRAQYEADLAKRRLLKVDPENRLVAQSLEDDWNDKLIKLDHAQREYETRKQELIGITLDVCEKSIQDVAADFPLIWNANSTTNRDRKRMVACIIEDVVLKRKERDVSIDMRFKGGDIVRRTCTIPTSGAKAVPIDSALIKRIDKLSNEHTAEDIAKLLASTRFRSPLGNVIRSTTVLSLLKRAGIPNRYERLRSKGMKTQEEIAEILGVSTQTVRVWRKAGKIPAEHYNNLKEYLYQPCGDKLPENYRGILESSVQ